MGAVLRCKESFNAWGKNYAPGDEVDAEDWPDPDALPSRLNNGFVYYDAGPSRRRGKAAAADEGDGEDAGSEKPKKGAK